MSIPQPENVKLEDVELAWSRTFGKDRTKNFYDVQKFIDSECIRLMVPYSPALNNVLYKTPTLGTKIGSGRIVYNSPYARYQYYGKLMVSSITGSPVSHGEDKVLTDKPLVYSTVRHPKAGKLWFERMKADHKNEILNGARRIVGR